MTLRSWEDGNTQSPPIQIEARLQQAALNMSALFIEEEFGGSEQDDINMYTVRTCARLCP
eukprot:1144128-Pelagomonas_calceolata.AAC.6